jgi:predicted phage terminase large subunit-like protein
MQVKWRPIKIKIEETGYARGLMPAVRRKSEMTGLWPNFDFIPPDNQTSKEARILSIQPMYKAGLIFFSTGLDEFVKEELKHELTRFPKYQHDDILDTLADMYQNEPVYGPLKESKSEKELLLLARQRMLENLDKYQEIFGEQEQPGESWRGLGAL